MILSNSFCEKIIFIESFFEILTYLKPIPLSQVIHCFAKLIIDGSLKDFRRFFLNSNWLNHTFVKSLEETPVPITNKLSSMISYDFSESGRF